MKKLLSLCFTFCVAIIVQAQNNSKVTVTDNGSSVFMDNGIVAITISKNSGDIRTFMYNGGNILTGGHDGGKFYWSWNMPRYQNPSNCTYTLTADPATNNYEYAEIKLHAAWSGNTTDAAMDVDVYYALKKNVSGVYAAAMLSHPAAYPLNPGGEWRMSSYPGSTFDWMTVDGTRNFMMPSAEDMRASLPVPGAPKEVSRITTGPFTNHYECKYDYSADFGDIDTWGWSSTKQNIGVWMTCASKEYYPGGPMKRELMCHATPVLLNMLGGTHYTGGSDGGVAAGEDWRKMFGPFLIYCNKVPKGTSNASNALWQDAKLQTKKEQAQWPYSWFTPTTYVKANGRGNITGQLSITDADHPSAANMWVGVAVTPESVRGITDFQLWCKNYQFWVQTDAKGEFNIPNVLPGTYNLYAFGSGVIGQYSKLNVATVSAGATVKLGVINWTPERVAPTIWEIGIPNRSAKEFKHGTDWWMGGTYPSLNWARFMDYNDEFPNDVTYTIGKSNYATDWNFVQPYLKGDSTPPVWTVKFDLTATPAVGKKTSLYVAAASAFLAPLQILVNGKDITGTPNGVNFSPASNATIRKGIHGAFAELRFNFDASLLHAGSNTVSFIVRRPGGDVQWDYVRLEGEVR